MSITTGRLALGTIADGNHRVAQNDEPEPTDADFAAADLDRDTNKGPKLAARNDLAALDVQLNGSGSRA